MRAMKKNNIPKFRSEEEEMLFWDKNDSVDFVDWSKAKPVTMSNLKPSVKSISVRLPEIMLEELKLLAHKKDIPYQSLMKIFISEKIEDELEKLHY